MKKIPIKKIKQEERRAPRTYKNIKRRLKPRHKKEMEKNYKIFVYEKNQATLKHTLQTDMKRVERRAGE